MSSFSYFAGRGSSIGYASAWYADGRGFHPHVRQLLEKEWALSTGNCLGGLRRNSVARLIDRTRNDLKCVEGP